MSWNLSNNATDYELSGNLTSEVIDIYGFSINYIKTQKVNMDKIYSEFTHLRADNDSVFQVSVYPENTAGFENHNDLFSKFGILGMDSTNLMISYNSLLKVYPDKQFQKGTGDLIVLPSKKVLEIVDIESQVNGLNNMFVYDNQKNVYILKCKPYNFNMDDINITTSPDEIPNFSLLFDIQNKSAEKLEQETQSKLVKNQDPVFGDLG
jgi:hypothetical protein